MTDAIVLLSGGQDSTTSLFWAREQFASLRALSVFYGQKHQIELRAARDIASAAGVPHDVYNLDVLAQIGGSALVGDGELAGSGGYVDVAMPQGLPTSFVPGRNMLFLATAASYAVHHGARRIVTGVCQTDFSGYPDCRRDFIDAMENAATMAMPSSCGPIEILTPLMQLTKAETVRLARRLPGCWDALALSVTCYNGQRPGCGTCPACELRLRGFDEADEVDPACATP